MQQEQLILPRGVTVVEPGGDRYVIEGTLGKGAFGAVYLVKERDGTHNLFALKEVINPNKEDRERFAFEGEVLKRLHHSALPRVHHVFENDKLKRVYLLMDYIAGKNLEVLRGEMPDKCFSLPQTLLLMAPIVDALKYLHTQDPPIVHRDIKPANIIVPNGRGEAMLADFGSAKEYVPGTATTTLNRRSPGYAALEQYRTGTTPATDVYGLGATLYALLTGSVPLDAPSRLVASLRGADPIKLANRLMPTIPQAVAEALHKALAIKVGDRFETVDEFWEVLTAHSEPQGAVTFPIELSQTLPLTEAISKKDRAQKVSAASHSEISNVLRMISGLCVALAIGMGLLSYLSGMSVLLISGVGVFLLALGVLLYDVFSRAGR